MLVQTREVLALQSGFDEESGIAWVKCYKKSKLKWLLYFLICIMSLGVVFVVCRWYRKLEVLLRYRWSAPADCTCVLVEARDGLLSIEQIDVKTTTPAAFGPSPVSAVQEFRVMTTQTFLFRHELFYFRIDRNVWTPARFPCIVSYREIHNEFVKGIRDPSLVFARALIYGKCVIDVPIPTISYIFLNEVLNPFFMFQAFSVILWMYEKYRLYAAVILVMTVLSIVAAILEVRRNAFKIRAMATHKTTAKVLREYMDSGDPVQVPSDELVPGDLIEIIPNWKLPCDVILLNGSCVVNEGMLTGESTPVLKDALPNYTHSIYDPFKDKKYTISAGSAVLQVRKKTVGVVVATGFGTTKGKLVKSILFPKPTKFKFQQDSVKFVVALGIVALFGAALSLKTLIDENIDVETTVTHSLDLITIAVPPALPIAMTIGISLAVARLAKKNISCISPYAVNAAGRTSLICFDKTGTLTEDMMELVGVLEADNVEFKDFAEDLKACNSVALKDCLCCCHALSVIDGQISGDPQEKSIMKSLGFNMNDDQGRSIDYLGRRFEICQIFHFSSVTKRMGVVAREVQTLNLFLFMKGAPEEIKELCSHVPNTYNDVIYQYTRKGLRVLACAYKALDSFQGIEGMGELEGNMKFLGLVVLQNKLKVETFGIIRTIKTADIAMVIATGDNVLTGLAVAREAELIPTDLDVYYCEILKDGTSLIWEKHSFTDSESLPPGRNLEWFTRLQQGDSYLGLALSGNAFEYLVRTCRQSNPQLLRFLLESLVVCGRMSPSQKMLLVEEMQSQGHLVVMCGDGANDCGALKAADVGLSVSTAEASVAAPFTAGSLLGLEDVLKEGRAALTTSFQCFKFIGLYSMIQFISVTTLFLMNTTLLDGQFLYIDLFTIIPLTFVMSNCAAYPLLVKQKPPGSLLSIPVLVSMLGHSIIQLCLIGATVLFLVVQPWYSQEGSGVGNPEPCFENSAVFLVSTAQYISVCVAFSIGPPFRRSAWRNWMFASAVIVITAFDVYMVLCPSEWTRDVVGLVDFPFDYRLLLLATMSLGVILTFLFEKVVVARLETCASRYQEGQTMKERHEELMRSNGEL